MVAIASTGFMVMLKDAVAAVFATEVAVTVAVVLLDTTAGAT